MSAVSVTCTSPSRLPSQDPRLMLLSPATATPTGAHCFPQRPVPRDAGAGSGRNPCVQEPQRTQEPGQLSRPPSGLGSRASGLGPRVSGARSAKWWGPRVHAGRHSPGAAPLCSRACPSGSQGPGHGLQEGGWGVRMRTRVLCQGPDGSGTEEGSWTDAGGPAWDQLGGPRGHGPRKRRAGS